MRLSIDEHAHGDSPLHRWDPRYKLIGLSTLMVSFAAVQDIRLAPAMLLVAASLAKVSRLPLRFLLTRLSYPGVFLLAVVLVLPFATGQTPLAHIGPLTLRQEGVYAALLVVARFAAILTTALVLFGTGPFLTTIRAMHALGLPNILTDMLLFFSRYLQDTASRLTTMQTAMRLRGFGGKTLSRHSLGALAALVGTLLIRSVEQSERVYRAMVLRGYGQQVRGQTLFRSGVRDGLALAGTLLVAVGFGVASIFLQ